MTKALITIGWVAIVAVIYAVAVNHLIAEPLKAIIRALSPM